MARYGAIALAVYGLAAAAMLADFRIRPWEGLETGASPYTGFLFRNLSSDAAWGHSFGVLGIVPLLALWVWRAWPDFLRPLLWSVVPAWCLLHLFLAPLDQARVLLLPQALVFLPAAYGIKRPALLPAPQGGSNTSRRARCRETRNSASRDCWGCSASTSCTTRSRSWGWTGTRRCRGERTLRVIHGESGTPWQYRLFTEGLVYGLVRLFDWGVLSRLSPSSSGWSSAC